ncbi:MAG: hypothetical protein GX958_01085 [Desulfitobacterium sp.]|mgnify:FL=1|nr:hypothetical protein [Desulfitobacterium sp.]
MTEQEQVKEQLQEQLEKVKQRLQILDMIEEKLFQMKELAQRVIDEDLTDVEIQEINHEVKNLGEQVKLLDREATQFS